MLLGWMCRRGHRRCQHTPEAQEGQGAGSVGLVINSKKSQSVATLLIKWLVGAVVCQTGHMKALIFA